MKGSDNAVTRVCLTILRNPGRVAEELGCAAEEMDGFDDEPDGEEDAEEAELRSRQARAGPSAAGPVGSSSAQASTRRPVSCIPPPPFPPLSFLPHFLPQPSVCFVVLSSSMQSGPGKAGPLRLALMVPSLPRPLQDGL